MLEVAIEAARRAGQILSDNFGKPQQIRFKGPRDIVAEADLLAQAAILEVIHARYPDHGILAEESAEPCFPAAAEGHPYTWLVDPLDGTTNYCRHYPSFAVSIALSHRGEVILGVVYDPLRDQMFTAQHGQGARLNGQRLHVSPVRVLAHTLVGFDWARRPEDRLEVARLVAGIAPEIGTMRTSGSAALGLCYVAAGWIDAYLHLSLKPWDAAAGSLIVQEAGGRVTDLGGHPWRLDSPRCLASNGLVHDKILSIVSQPIKPMEPRASADSARSADDVQR